MPGVLHDRGETGLLHLPARPPRQPLLRQMWLLRHIRLLAGGYVRHILRHLLLGHIVDVATVAIVVAALTVGIAMFIAIKASSQFSTCFVGSTRCRSISTRPEILVLCVQPLVSARVGLVRPATGILIRSIYIIYLPRTHQCVFCNGDLCQVTWERFLGPLPR